MNGPPPPINYATHPLRSQRQNNVSGKPAPPASLFNSGFILSPAALRSHVFHPGPWVGAVHPINKPDYQGGSADIQEYGRQQDGSDGRQQDGSDGRQQDGLADTVTEAASANFEPNNQLGSLTPSGAHGGGPLSRSTPPTSPTKQKRTKFYAVTVGKRCGVFQRWTYVSALTSGTPGATFQGFNSLEEAEDEYFAAKALGHVKVVRVPGDELIYGPLSDAKM